MRPPVGEEMSRQPSLPSLTARGNPGADLASPRAKQPNHPTQRPVRTRRLNRARPMTTTRTPHHQAPQHDPLANPLTRPRSFRDAVLARRSCHVVTFPCPVRCAHLDRLPERDSVQLAATRLLVSDRDLG